ncbi:MAG: enoyl-CoA hydratase/isomerase family protein, partial [Planctomycetota bacterium]
AWHPGVFEQIGSPDWQQLYVNAEHDGTVGVVTISRESYNRDVDRELNRALDWLRAEGIERMILTGDFHLATQMVGADTSDFYPALEAEGEGRRVSGDWSRTARRLDDEFKSSVAFVNGKRCLGGMLELTTHCHYLVAVEDAQLGMPEVTVPVVPGMEGCHWPFRKASSGDWPKLLRLLLSGRPVRAAEAVGWLADFAGPMDKALQCAWQAATGGDHGLKRRAVQTGTLEWEPTDVGDLAEADSPAVEAARKAIIDAIQASHGTSLDDALEVQSKHSAGFMLTEACRSGRVGAEYTKTMKV